MLYPHIQRQTYQCVYECALASSRLSCDHNSERSASLSHDLMSLQNVRSNRRLKIYGQQRTWLGRLAMPIGDGASVVEGAIVFDTEIDANLEWFSYVLLIERWRCTGELW
jgi:hypothetical protein